MNLYKYIHYNTETKEISEGEAFKEPLIWVFNGGESPGVDYEDITTEELIIEKEIEFISKRKADGADIVAQNTAQMRALRISSGVSHAVFNEYVYSDLNSTISFVLAGDFLDGYEELKKMVVNDYFTEELKVKLKKVITGYIVGSGTYPEYTGFEIDEFGDIIIE